jgi:hypothetical protein
VGPADGGELAVVTYRTPSHWINLIVVMVHADRSGMMGSRKPARVDGVLAVQVVAGLGAVLVAHTEAEKVGPHRVVDDTCSVDAVVTAAVLVGHVIDHA